MWNITFTKVWKQVYPVLSWDSWLSVTAGCISLPIFVLVWFLLYWCTNYKIVKKLKRGKQDLSTSEVSQAERSGSIDGDKELILR